MESLYPIVGMSPGNSYFKDTEVRYLLQKVIGQFGRACILIADIPAIATYEAYGYAKNKARSKAILKGNNLKNRVRKIQKELGIAEGIVRIIDWEGEIEGNTEYQQYFQKIKHLYNSNIAFREAVKNTTQQVVDNSRREIDNISDAVETAVHYLLSELAFIEYSTDFLKVSSVTYIYHKNWPVYEDYIAGKFDHQPKPYLGFQLLENPYETFIPLQEQDQINTLETTYKRIQRTGIIRASFSHYPPAFIKDSNTDKYSGIFHDVLQYIAQELHATIEWTEETGYGAIIDGLNDGRFDLFASTVWATPERMQQVDFTTSLYDSRVEMWVRADKKINVAHIRSNSDFRIAIRENDITHSIVQHDFPHVRFVYTPQLYTMNELLDVVADDKADATFAEPYTVELFNKISHVKLVNVQELSPVRIYANTFMLKKGDEQLMACMNTCIKKLKITGKISEFLEIYE